MDAGSISASDTLVDTPNGLLPGNSVTTTPTSLTTLRIGFPTQNTVGYYELQTGPQIQDIYGVPMADVYVGSFIIWPPIISGRVTDTNGLPVRYVTLRLEGDPVPAVTDANGFYSIEVVPGSACTITPARGTSMFIPQSRVYASVSANLTNQNFVMVAPASLHLTQEQQGTNLNLRWFGINGVRYQPLSSTNLVDWQPYAGPLLGTNGQMSLSVPLGIEPVRFFRFRTDY
jgi:hypothetical protein